MKASAKAILAAVFAISAISAVYAEGTDAAKTEPVKSEQGKHHQDKKQELQNVIAKYDKNSNGKLDGDEIEAAKKDGVDEKLVTFASKDPSERKGPHKKGGHNKETENK